MRRRGKILRVLALVLAVSLFLPVLGVTARTVDEIEAEQEQLDDESAALDEKLAQLRDDISKQQEYLDTLNEQIAVKQESINQARADIETLNERISVLTLTLEKSAEKIDSTMEQFKARLVQIYKAGNVNTLEILLDSSSFSDFAMRSELLDAVSKQDKQMMDTIREYMDETKDEREECNRSKETVAKLEKKLENEQEELNVLYEEAAAVLAQLEAEEADAEARQAEIEAEKEANVAEIEAIIEAERKRREEEARRQQAAGHYGGGTGGVEGFHPVWPLPGVTYVSQYYGEGGHKGLDIAGPWGTPVVAAETGTVIDANGSDGWGQGWGYYVLIYHNDTFTTRYAHLSSLTVGEGQSVTQGEVIGYEGSTGNSTGPHLHFEVYYDGSRVDPMQYL